MKTDPRVKLLALLLLTTAALIFDRLPWLLSLLAASLLLAVIWGARPGEFFRRARGFIGLLLAVALLQCLFTRGGEPWLQIGDFTLIYREGARMGAAAALRYLVIVCAAAVMSAESQRRVVAAFSAMGLPYTLVFMLMTALRFLPLFRSSFQDAVISAQLRGVDLKAVPRGKRLGIYGSLLLPVLSDALLRSRELAVAMEAQGFGAYRERTSYYKLTLQARDWLFVAILLAAFAAALIVYF
ncbi:MAG: energy-coupling factor transporter transmembrane protein EcfT [Firmicutes bacterium]|nr:energy-coupling factor transporter transmembrane protein EcfT [Bacillota bacterium]